MVGSPRVGVVIPTADPGGMPARRCIEVVRATTGHLDVDVEVVVSSGPEFRISRSLNRGVAAVPGADAWVLLNDDAFMDAGWLDALLGAMRAHPGVGVWGAVLRYPDGRLQHAGGRIALSPFEFLLAASRRGAPLWALRNIWRERGREHPYMFVHHTRVSERNVLDFVTGACMLVTRACRERIGGYDEDYLFGAEDVDYSLRALEAGFEIGLATRATGVHLDRGTGAALAERARTSEALFRERWSGARIRGAARGRVGVYA